VSVFCNSGPLIALGRIGALDIFFRLFGKVHIPTAVYQETVIEGAEHGFIDARMTQMAIRREQLIVLKMFQDDLPQEIASLDLDAGEKEAIYLSKQESGSLILLDDLKAREEAKRLGLAVKGALGVLVQAYREKLISFAEVSAFIETIIRHDDIWISAELCREVLRQIETEH
jgi:predicted nucleic acid-binding protein